LPAPAPIATATPILPAPEPTPPPPPEPVPEPAASANLAGRTTDSTVHSAATLAAHKARPAAPAVTARVEAAPTRSKPERQARETAAHDPEPSRLVATAPLVVAAPPVVPLPVAPPPPPPPVPVVVAAAPVPAAPAGPQLVAPSVLEANRMSGDRAIVPDAATQGAIGRSGADKIISTFKLCVAADGKIDVVTQMKASGFPEYDEKIRNEIRKDWRYRPYLVNGKPQAVCTALRFVYSQK
jgi:hypothetical protein